ncbi:unnamed protein product [Hydatigera taeniaeformis]|uniref:Protein kinase domain-containing protein n=1 Tax=Hydatigena taeniaeformis TaxID=6205 RepID=A0A0R3WSF6_HYDTA|nr:unnamed protein product [Hydatigera taeniaeformis]
MVEPKDFEITKFIGNGCYSTIYDAVSTNERDRGAKYALKRIFILNASALIRAIQEQRTLIHISMEPDRSPFLTTLYYSFRVHRSPVLVMTKGSGVDLCDLLFEYGCLEISEAQFYICEVICGLEYLHSKEIIHLDIKPENILLADTGHILITDFDSSYDRYRRLRVPLFKDDPGTPLYMAPEVAKKVAISSKADVWSMAVLMAAMISGPIRELAPIYTDDYKLAEKGEWCIKVFDSLEPSLQFFFCCCLQVNFEVRPSIEEVKDLSFFSDIKWDEVAARKMQPPYQPSDLEISKDKVKFKFNPRDPLILQSAFGEGMPVIWRTPQYILRKDRKRSLVTLFSNYERLDETGVPLRKIEKCFTNFDFIHADFVDAEIKSWLNISPPAAQSADASGTAKRELEEAETSSRPDNKRPRVPTDP